MTEPEILASAVVCTHNRSKRLEASCESVMAEARAWPFFELVLVDSASTDDTGAIAEDLVGRFAPACRLVSIAEKGLSRARNAGAAAARGGLIAFLDDDARARPGWLRALWEAVEQTGADAVGGPVRPLFRGELPDWICGSLVPYWSVWDQGERRLSLGGPEFPRGTNMAFRRQVFADFGGFNESLGRRGSRLLSCEETELFERLAIAGRGILYEPAAVVDHEVPAERLTKAFFRRRFWSQGASEAVLAWSLGGRSGLRSGLARTWDYHRIGCPARGAWARQRNFLRWLSWAGYLAAALPLTLSSTQGRSSPAG